MSSKPKRSVVLRVCVTPADAVKIRQNAALMLLTVSQYLRQLGLGYQPPPLADLASTQDLLRAAGDLGRLGGLLKMWLSNEERFVPGTPDTTDVQALYDALIEQKQQVVLATEKLLHGS